MAKETGLGDRLLVDGINLSGDIGSIGNIHGGPAAVDVTGIDVEGFERIGGLLDSSIEFSSWWNNDRAHPVLSALPTTDRAVTYCRGLGLGRRGAGLLAKQIDYPVKRGNDGTLTLDISAVGAAGIPLEWGRQGTDGLRDDDGPTSGEPLDYGVAFGADGDGTSAFGLRAYLHVLAFTGTSATVVVEESADDGDEDSWTTALSFGAQTAVGATRAATSLTRVMERYLRVTTSGTFSNLEFLVLLVRPVTVAP